VTPRHRLAARIASNLLFLGGALAIAAVMHTYASAHAFQTRELARLQAHRDLPTSLAPVVEAPRHAFAEGEAVGEIRIDRLHMDAVIAQGDSNAVLRRAVGHLSDTPMPGDAGNVVLAAHRDTFFRPLKEIRPGDVIDIVDMEHHWQYRVEWSRVVSPSATDVLADTEDNTLTLVTCYPFEYIGRAPTRFVVRAVEVSR
jgi:sortase A